MLMLITGVPGAGKSLRAVWHIKRMLAEGRKVYADIDELTLDGVEPSPQDWRDTPEGSVVVYDEAQRVFGSSGRGGGRSEREDIQAFETHRHTGHDIVFITQHPSLLHAHVRRLVGRHEHVMRIFGRNRANILWRDRCWEVDKSSERRTANAEMWGYPADLFKHYKSATIHQNTGRIPRALKVGAVVVLALVVAVGYSFSHSALFAGDIPTASASGQSSPSVVSSAALASADRDSPVELPWYDQDWASQGTVAPVGGCIATDTRCRCFTTEGQPIRLSTQECQRRVRQPLPYAIDTTRSPHEDRGDYAATESGAQRSAEPQSRELAVWNDGRRS